MDTIKEIYQKLIELWNSNLELVQMIKDSKKKVSDLFDFFDKFFSIVPLELILLFLFVSLVMILLNNISPTTPRINITIGVVLFGVIYMYVVHIFTNEWKFFRMLYISAFILVPAYFIEIVSVLKKFYLRYKLKYSELDSKAIQINLQSIHLYYAEFVNSQNFIKEEPEKFFTSLQKLETSISELSSLIKNSKTQNKTS